MHFFHLSKLHFFHLSIFSTLRRGCVFRDPKKTKQIPNRSNSLYQPELEAPSAHTCHQVHGGHHPLEVDFWNKETTAQTFGDNNLVGGFNPFEKYESKWESSPNRGENKKYLKPPPRQFPNLEFMVSDQNDGTKHLAEK